MEFSWKLFRSDLPDMGYQDAHQEFKARLVHLQTMNADDLQSLCRRTSSEARYVFVRCLQKIHRVLLQKIKSMENLASKSNSSVARQIVESINLLENFAHLVKETSTSLFSSEIFSWNCRPKSRSRLHVLMRIDREVSFHVSEAIRFAIEDRFWLVHLYPDLFFHTTYRHCQFMQERDRSMMRDITDLSTWQTILTEEDDQPTLLVHPLLPDPSDFLHREGSIYRSLSGHLQSDNTTVQLL
jgi:hypothetical protein